jgi:tetratricopeptide (TPR) repeat protein
MEKNELLKKTHDEMESGVINAIKSILASEQDPNTRNKILLSSTYGLFDTHHYEAAKVFALEILKHQPYNEKVWMSLGYLHFMRFEFQEAIQAFQKSKSSESSLKLIEISKKYQNYQKPISNYQIAELILEPNETQLWSWLRYHVLSSHRYRHTLSKHLDLIKIVLSELNPNATVQLNYSISENGGILSFEKSQYIKTIILSEPDKTVFDSLDLKEIHMDGHGYIEGVGHLEDEGVFIIY